MVKKKENSGNIQHPLFATSTINWIRLVIDNNGFDIEYLPRAIFITLFSIFIIPARLLFKIIYDPKIAKKQIIRPPIFIIGHWRSGTTFLHELLGKDPHLCYVSLWHTLLPNSFLIFEPSKKYLSRFLPKQRPMDAMDVDIDGPYEEEAGMAVLDRWSFFHCFHFPKNARNQYNKSVHFEGLSDYDKINWKKNYLKFLKTITYANNGKQLILKNPSNTARISTLLEIFPNARFIHIYRNPYKVYFSTLKMRTRVLDKLALQKTTDKEIQNHVFEDYIKLMNSYFEHKDLIPKGHLVEIRYEDFVKDPLGKTNYIYEKLGISGFDKAESFMKEYLDQKAGYKTNVYKFDQNILEKIKKTWGFTIKLWGYEPSK
jgi:hypothetical protein